jgi:hypothetical protein
MDGRPMPFVTMRSPEAELSIVKDIGGDSGGEEQRWVNQDPTLTFRVPRQPAVFRMDYEVPEVILEQTGPLRMQCWIAERPVAGIVVGQAGKRRYEVPLPDGLNTGDVVMVRLHTENPYVAKGDGARLSFLLRSAGFVSR